MLTPIFSHIFLDHILICNPVFWKIFPFAYSYVHLQTELKRIIKHTIWITLFPSLFWKLTIWNMGRDNRQVSNASQKPTLCKIEACHSCIFIHLGLWWHCFRISLVSIFWETGFEFFACFCTLFSVCNTILYILSLILVWREKIT